MMLVVLVFRIINNDSVVTAIFTAASYTYGPLLGLFAFGILTKLPVADRLVPYICVLSPVLCYVLHTYVVVPYTAYAVGFVLISRSEESGVGEGCVGMCGTGGGAN